MIFINNLYINFNKQFVVYIKQDSFVYIITKEPLRNSAQIAHSLTMIGGSRPDNNTTLNASLVTDDHKAGIYLFGQSVIVQLTIMTETASPNLASWKPEQSVSVLI